MSAYDPDSHHGRPNRDLYSILGLQRGALSPDIQAAYRRLAREWHPDLNHREGAVGEFMLVNEAYSTLGDPKRRSAYDQSLKSNSPPPKERLRELARCTECGRPTAQPRVIIVRRCVGIGIWSHVRRAEGLYCSSCAHRAATQASLAAATFGWWALPLGPIFTIWCIGSNAFVGLQRHPADGRLALGNAYAFLQRGEYRLAKALARQTLRGATGQIAIAAQEILQKAEALGAGHRSVALQNPWRATFVFLSVHALLCVAPPTALIITLVFVIGH